MNENRHYSLLDQFCLNVDQALRTVCGNPKTSGRPYPATNIKDSLKKYQHSARMMRVNHAGEVAAQALYQAQGFVSRNARLKEQLLQAAIEEGDHLDWCRKRLVELGDHTSYLNPFWYLGSFTIGFFAGIMGDEWSLAFLAETENQVVKHLDKHLTLLPDEDKRSLAILAQMQKDEAVHRDDALLAGAKVLPGWVKQAMRLLSKVMVKTAYWI